MSDAHNQQSNLPELVLDDNLTEEQSQDLITTIPKTASTPVVHPTLDMDVNSSSFPTGAQDRSDAASSHSLPLAHVTANQPPSVQPFTARSTDHSTSFPESSNRLTTHIDRATSLRNNRRSVMDVSYNYHLNSLN